MNVQEYIEFYHRKKATNEEQLILDLCLIKPLPKEYPIEDNRPGAILSVIQVNTMPNEYTINTATDRELIQFADGERKSDITAFLDCCMPTDHDYYNGNQTIYIEFSVDRKYYETYIPNEPTIYMHFMINGIERLELLEETSDSLTMLMYCESINTFALLMESYKDYCAIKMQGIKNVPELNAFLTESVKVDVDIAEYSVFHA